MSQIILEMIILIGCKIPTTLWCRHHALYVAVIIHDLECNVLFFCHWSLNCDSYLQLTGQKADLSLKGSPYWMAPEVPTSCYFYIILHKFLPALDPHHTEIFIFSHCSS